MKIIRVPYSYKAQLFIDNFIPIAGLITFALGLRKLIENEWLSSIVLLLITGFFIWYKWQKITGQLFIIAKDYVYRFLFIIHILDEGFIVVKGKEQTEYLWKDISTVDLQGEDKLVIQLKNSKPLVLDNQYWNWYLLLKSIPKECMINDKIERFRHNVFTNLKTCNVCGKIAIYKRECLSCRVDYSDVQKEDFEDFIKIEQQELFSIDEEDETVDFYKDNKDGFDFDKNWQPLITEEEIIKDYEFLNEQTITPWIIQLRKHFKT